MKFLINNYYFILAIIIIYLLFNVTVRDPLINWIYNTPNDRPVTDANAYFRADRIRNVLSYLLVGCLIFLEVLSIVLLILPEGRVINKWLLISVIILVGLIFFGVMAIGGFS